MERRGELRALCKVAAAALLLLLPAAPAGAVSAISIASDHAYGYCADGGDRESAAQCAIDICAQSAADPSTCDLDYTGDFAGSYAFAMGDGGAWGSSAAKPSAAEAEEQALSSCAQYATGCVIVASWEESVGLPEMETTDPLELDEPESTILIMMMHGSFDEITPDPCNLDIVNAGAGTPAAIADLEGTEIDGMTVVVDRFCTPHKLGEADTIKVELRKGDIEERLQAYLGQGVPPEHIFLAGHSAGAWASLLVKLEWPDAFNAVIAMAPAFAGETATRGDTWWAYRQEYLDAFAAAEDLAALVFSFEGDTFETPDVLGDLASAADVEFVPVTADEEAEAGCGTWAHGIPMDACFAPVWGNMIGDFIAERLGGDEEQVDEVAADEEEAEEEAE